ncbi:MAG: hypothetical protein HXY25_09675, partial [Alphaproteobacteria bacterium]|nr:hypothetical protein [Alphaproteobacteria bacterium]
MAHTHPEPDCLADFAAGRLSEAKAVVVATHATLCPDCRAAIADGEAVAGALLEACEAPVSPGLGSAVRAALDAPPV